MSLSQNKNLTPPTLIDIFSELKYTLDFVFVFFI